MSSLDERFRIIDEMMGLYMQNVSESRVKGYLRHLPANEIPTDILRAAVAGCIEHGSQRGAPTVAEVRRRAGELGTRRLHTEVSADVIPLHPECKRVVHETPHGPLLCCREGGHVGGSCEPWFNYGGPQPGDAAVIRGLIGAGGAVVPIRPLEGEYEEPVI